MNEERELPEGWCWASLEELVYRIGDVDHKMPKAVALGIPYISTKNFYGRDSIDFEAAKQISHEDYMALSRKIQPEKGDILLSRYGTVGEVRKVSTDVDFQASYSIAIIKTLPIPILTNYLVFALRSEVVQVQIKRDTRATAQPDLGLEHIRHFEIPLAPLAEQQHIVSAIEERFTILDAVTTALQQNKQKLKRARASVLKYAVEGKLTEKWRIEHPATESGSQLLDRILAERHAKWEAEQVAKGKDPRKLRYEELKGPNVSGLSELPGGWCWASIEQLGDIGTGATPLRSRSDYYDEGIVPWVTSSALNTDRITIIQEYITEKALRETNAKIFPAGTLLVAMYGEGKTRGKVSELSFPAATNQACAAIVFDPISVECKPFVKIFLLSSYDEIRRSSVGGVQPNLNLTKIREIMISLPSLAEQQQIVAEVERRLSVIEQAQVAIETSLKRIERARQSILEQAFSGRLVPQDPHDEPASVLLERIQQERASRAGEGKQRGRNGGVKAARGRKTPEQEFVPQWQLLKDAQQSASIQDGASESYEVKPGERGRKEEFGELVQMPLFSL